MESSSGKESLLGKNHTEDGSALIDYYAANEYKAWRVTIACLSITLIIIGTIGNSITVVYCATTHHGKKVTRRLQMGIALSHIFTLLTGPMEFFLIHQFNTSMINYNNFTCVILSFFNWFCQDSAIFLLELLALERAFSIRFPLRKKEFFTTRNKLIIFFTGYIYIIIKDATSSMKFKVKNKFECGWLFNSSSYAYIHHFIYLFQSYVVLIATNRIIYQTAKQTQSSHSHGGHTLMSFDSSTGKRSIQILRIVLCLTGLFLFFTLFPVAAFITKLTGKLSEKKSGMLIHLSMNIYYSCNAGDFICYLVTSEDYRRTVFGPIVSAKSYLSDKIYSLPYMKPKPKPIPNLDPFYLDTFFFMDEEFKKNHEFSSNSDENSSDTKM